MRGVVDILDEEDLVWEGKGAVQSDIAVYKWSCCGSPETCRRRVPGPRLRCTVPSLLMHTRTREKVYQAWPSVNLIEVAARSLQVRPSPFGFCARLTRSKIRAPVMYCEKEEPYRILFALS